MANCPHKKVELISLILMIFLLGFACSDLKSKSQETLIKEINANLKAFAQYQPYISLDEFGVFEYKDPDGFYYRAFNIKDLKNMTIEYDL